MYLINKYILFTSLILLLFPGVAISYSEPEVDSISINGDIPISEEDLLEGTGLKIGASLLLITSDAVHDAIVNNLKSLGYLTPSVVVEWPSWGESQGVVALIIDVGELYIISGLVIDGVTIFRGDSLVSLYPTTPGNPITPADTSAFRNSIIDAYSERGYIRAVCTITLIGGNSNSVGNDGNSAFRTIRCTVDEGKQYYLGEISVSGLETIRPILVTRELLISPGDSLNEKLLMQSMRNIYQMGLFKGVRFTYEGENTLQNTIDLMIEVTEAQYHIVDIGCGYLSPEALFLEASWMDPNIMGNEQKLILSMYGMTYIGDDIGKEFNPTITYDEAWFLSTRWKFRLNLGFLYYKIPGLDQRSWSFSPSIARTIWNDMQFSAGIEYEYEKYWETGDEGNSTSDWYGTGSMNATVVYDTRMPVMDPIRGHRYMFNGKVSGGILGGSDFCRFEAEVRKLFCLSDRFIVSLRGRIGNAFTYSTNTSIPPDDRFFLGGGTTIRGYAYNSIGPEDEAGNPIGGSDEVLGNIEVRAGILGDLWIVLFLDAGGLWDAFDTINIDSFAFGTGIGLRYNTPFGPIRLDYGFAPSHRNSVETGRFYLGLGQAF